MPAQSPILPATSPARCTCTTISASSGATPAAVPVAAAASRLGLRARLGAQPHHLQSRRGVGGCRRRLIYRHQHLRRPFGHADQCRGIAAIHPAVVAECADAHRIRPPGGTRRQRDAHAGQPRSFIRRRRTRRLKHAEQTGVQRHQVAGDLQLGDAILRCALAGTRPGLREVCESAVAASDIRVSLFLVMAARNVIGPLKRRMEGVAMQATLLPDAFIVVDSPLAAIKALLIACAGNPSGSRNPRPVRRMRSACAPMSNAATRRPARHASPRPRHQVSGQMDGSSAERRVLCPDQADTASSGAIARR